MGTAGEETPSPLNMGGVQQSNTAVSSEMFIDYKQETTCFGTFSHHQVSSMITQDHSIYGARARCAPYVEGSQVILEET